MGRGVKWGHTLSFSAALLLLHLGLAKFIEGEVVPGTKTRAGSSSGRQQEIALKDNYRRSGWERERERGKERRRRRGTARFSCDIHYPPARERDLIPNALSKAQLSSLEGRFLVDLILVYVINNNYSIGCTRVMRKFVCGCYWRKQVSAC